MNERDNKTEQQGSDNSHGIRFPWWGSIIIATAIYIVLKHVLPNSPFFTNKFSRLVEIGIQIAPILTIGFLLLGAKQLYDGVPVNEQEDEPEDKR